MTQMLNVFQVMTDRVAFVEVAGVEMGKHALVSDLSSSFSLGEFGFSLSMQYHFISASGTFLFLDFIVLNMLFRDCYMLSQDKTCRITHSCFSHGSRFCWSRSHIYNFSNLP